MLLTGIGIGGGAGGKAQGGKAGDDDFRIHWQVPCLRLFLDSECGSTVSGPLPPCHKSGAISNHGSGPRRKKIGAACLASGRMSFRMIPIRAAFVLKFPRLGLRGHAAN
jgi:hypothetical protein